MLKKVFISKWDNGYTATVKRTEQLAEEGQTTETEERLVFRSKEELITKLTEIL